MAERTKTVSVSIDAPFEQVFDYVTNDLNWPDWAMGIIRRARVSDGTVWLDPVATVNRGPLTKSGPGIAVELAPSWADRTVDWVFYADTDGRIPSRIEERQGGVDYVWTLSAGPEQTDDSLQESADILAGSLATLKTLIETRG